MPPCHADLDREQRVTGVGLRGAVVERRPDSPGNSGGCSFEHELLLFTTAPVGAIEMALACAGRRKDDVELYEINEAFAVATAACTKLAGISSDA